MSKFICVGVLSSLLPREPKSFRHQQGEDERIQQQKSGFTEGSAEYDGSGPVNNEKQDKRKMGKRPLLPKT